MNLTLNPPTPSDVLARKPKKDPKAFLRLAKTIMAQGGMRFNKPPKKRAPGAGRPATGVGAELRSSVGEMSPLLVKQLIKNGQAVVCAPKNRCNMLKYGKRRAADCSATEYTFTLPDGRILMLLLK